MITIFTGAGASKPFGYPVTTEFFAGHGANLQRRPTYTKVKEFLNKEIVDVEDALRLLYPYVDLLDTPTGKMLESELNKHWFKDIPEFVKTSNDCCFDHYGRSPNEKKVREAYFPILEYCRWTDQGVALFTTNYDPVTDTLMEIAESQGVPSHDGFNRLGR